MQLYIILHAMLLIVIWLGPERASPKSKKVVPEKVLTALLGSFLNQVLRTRISISWGYRYCVFIPVLAPEGIRFEVQGGTVALYRTYYAVQYTSYQY